MSNPEQKLIPEQKPQQCKHVWAAVKSEIVDCEEMIDPDDNSSSIYFEVYETTYRCLNCGDYDISLSSTA